MADTVPGPFRMPVHRWIDVLTGTAVRSSHPLSPVTVCGYLRRTVPVLKTWHGDGIENLRAVTHDHITRAITELTGFPAQARSVALRSLFRALKREGLLFQDPARHIPVPAARTLPKPLHEDQLRGALRQIPAVRAQLTFVLAAVHALTVHDQRGLLMDDLDRAAGTLLVRRPGALVHTVYLDELTSRLIVLWLSERYRRWPAGANPHLLVTAHTALDPAHPPVSSSAIDRPLHRMGHQVGRLRRDRILDEARHNTDPLNLVRLFGIHPRTAMTYLCAAHPGRFRPDAVAP
ncbi:site-specific integrase [Streptomyces sp. cg35]|uniref:site-specific integrase n=1 Tax=Streptomyces sp. cg35 TaxID=3421650 RepID=UPI003D17E0DB